MTRVLTLASTSPRRKQLLEMLGFEVLVRPSHIPEEHQPGEAPLAYTERLARAKAEHVPGDFVIGADTTVVLDGKMAKVLSWYDNEWGYSCRVGDLAKLMAQKGL